MQKKPDFNYKGFRYTPWEDVEEDNIKIFHELTYSNGKKISIPWSPYSTPTDDELKMWIDIGCPTHNVNFNSKSLLRAWEEYNKDPHVKKIEKIFDL